MIWWWQCESNEALVPLSRTKLGWSVTIRSMHDGFLPGSKLVGSEIIWVKFKEKNKSSISLHSGLESPPGHQCWECSLKL